MTNNKDLKTIQQQFNTPKTETRIILNDWQTEAKTSKLSRAARSKVVNNGSYISSRVFDLVPVYGPCSTCGVSDKKFELKLNLRNAVGGHLKGSAYNTNDALSEADDILSGDGDWAGGAGKGGCYRKKNREELADKINDAIDEHIDFDSKGNEGKRIIKVLYGG